MPIAYCLIPNSPVTFPLLPHLTYETNRKEAAPISDFQRVYQQYSQRLYRFLFALTGSEGQDEELWSSTIRQHDQWTCTLYDKYAE